MKTEITLKHYPKREPFRHKLWTVPESFYIKPMTFQQIADKLAISTATVRLCISKFQKGGLDAALFDVQRPGRPSEITDDAKAWMIHIACQRPTDVGRILRTFKIKKNVEVTDNGKDNF